jgi:hypothetical protein
MAAFGQKRMAAFGQKRPAKMLKSSDQMGCYTL